MFKSWLLSFSLLLVSLSLMQCELKQKGNNTQIKEVNTIGQIEKAGKPRRANPDIQFPADAGIFNVTGYGAKPNDGVDDTAEIQVAIATALKSNSRYSALPFIYFPKGTYNISDQLESRVGIGGWSDGWRAGMILIGESGKGTVLKLANNLADFSNPKTPRAAIKTGSEKDTESNPSGEGNRAFRHSIYNMTIDIGRGNSGAVGIDYLANNRGAIEDVTIRSQSGEGYAGILMKRYAPGPALVKNTSIEGFDYGVWIDNYEYSMTFEHLTLKNQQIAGIFNQENVLNIRDLVSTNSVPAIESVSSNGKITLVDSSFSGGDADNSAIVSKGKMFVRNLTSTGYGMVVDDRTKTNRDIASKSLTTEVREYISKEVESLSDNPQMYSLSLPIEETPEFHSNDLAQWENVVAHGATPGDRANDDAKAIQLAIDSNRAIVYLPRGEYHIKQTIILRGKVRKLLGMQAAIKKKEGFKGNTLIRFEGSTNATIIEHLRIGGIVEHASSQTLAMRHVDIGGYRNTPKGKGKLFVEDAIGAPYQINSPQQVWARQLNAEFGKVPLIQNHGGTVWILGMKTEGKVTAIETVGGTTELLGALLYPLHNVPASIPAFINDRGRVALSYAISGQKYAVQVKERRRDRWYELDSKNAPSRGEGASVPLYTGSSSDN